MLILLVIACSSDPRVPQGDWRNVAPAIAREVSVVDGGQLVRVEEAHWDFWAKVPPQPGVKVGDSLLLGDGPSVRLVVNGERLPNVLEIDQLAVVTPQVAALALAMPELPDDRASIASLHQDRAALHQRPVVAAGRVVKASMNVFDTNWYHIRDGSGDEATGDHDLTFTSSAVLAVGDVVRVEGPLTADKDLGFGYFYAAIMEDASVSRLDGAAVAHAQATMSAPVKLPPRDPQPTQGPTAPGGLDVRGLTLGASTDAEVDAWVAGLSCDREPALARRTVHLRCRDAQARWPAPGAPATELLVARPEEQAAIHHLSVARTHADAANAIADWQQAFDAAQTRLGEPLRSRPPTPDSRVDGRFAFNAAWRFDDLEVGLSVMRLRPDGSVTVRERWFIPGVEESLDDRGIGVHGAGTRSAPNPHVRR